MPHPSPRNGPVEFPQASACEPYRELIVDGSAACRNAMAIWQDLVDDHGFPAGYASVNGAVVSTVLAAARRRGPGGHHHGPGRRSTS